MVQLTISGCLGPCDLPNVACIHAPAGSIWIGKLFSDEDYQELLSWASRSAELGTLLDLPDSLSDRVFDRFTVDSLVQ